MVCRAGDAYAVVVVGGGIAGGALATVLARGGKTVLVLERDLAYRDRVRGEYLQPWGVAEAVQLALHGVLTRAGGTHHARLVNYDEILEPAEAEASAVLLDEVLPGVPGTLGAGHPGACQALAEAASQAGAHVLRGVASVQIEFGHPPQVVYRLGTAERVARCRLM
ncbi:MAG: FAD-dependent monooxygenase [Chloroflexi bacterium]|nr:FAD-dependent monooxygenase [Chloroflexota bacterium]